MPRSVRNGPKLDSKEMCRETQERLLELADSVYPGKARRAVDICPVAVNHTIDNEEDAQETIRRMERRLEGEEA